MFGNGAEDLEAEILQLRHEDDYPRKGEAREIDIMDLFI
jgi:hypothetical protein